AATWNQEGTHLASAAADKFAKVFDAKTGKYLRSFEGHTHHVLGVGWNRTGRTIATAGADDVVKVWSVETGQQVRTVQGFAKQATALRYLPFGDQFVVAAGGAPVRLVGENGQTVRNFDAQGAFIYALALSADGRLVAAGGLDGALRVWGAGDGRSLAVFTPPAK
ncbi:MAG: WD40 repeat domain-containing protein, partial [Candidatus Rokuibacteriota bacterium]